MYSQHEITELLIEKIESNKNQLKDQWQNPQNTKTHHFVLDDLLPEDIPTQIYDAFPKNGEGFYSLDSFREKKRTSVNLRDYPEILGAVTYAFQDKRVVDLIAEIAGFEKIEPDPLLYAGGLSMMFKNDFLNPHLDNSHDGKRQSYRRLNLLYYVSPDWKPEYGGNFELWDEFAKIPKTIVALANRFVVMETNKLSWHSVSKVQIDEPRCCVSNYYFSEESPDQTDYFHVTSFSGRPEEKLKSIVGVVDNALRNIVSKTLKTGRGKKRVNKSE